LEKEIIQIQRKKEEAIFLKRGIDKRATCVTKFLEKYLNKDYLLQFKLFLQKKSIYALQLRHFDDYQEMIKSQLDYLNNLQIINKKKTIYY
jgi:hypothetical protein